MKEPQGLTQHIAAVIGMEGSAFCKSVSLAAQKDGGVSRGLFSQGSKGTGFGSQSGYKGAPPVANRQATGTSFTPRLKYTPAELDAMRRDNIFFKCKGPYSKTHICPKKELHILTVINRYDVEILDEGDAAVDVTMNTDQVELSLNAFLGIDTPTTTKLMGVFGNVGAVVMIDSGATHNFVSPRVVEAAKLQLATDMRFQVLLGTGVTVEALGVCRGITFSLQDNFFQSDFVSLELGNVDVVLGVQWLRCLGKCLVD